MATSSGKKGIAAHFNFNPLKVIAGVGGTAAAIWLCLQLAIAGMFIYTAFEVRPYFVTMIKDLTTSFSTSRDEHKVNKEKMLDEFKRDRAAALAKFTSVESEGQKLEAKMQEMVKHMDGNNASSSSAAVAAPAGKTNLIVFASMSMPKQAVKQLLTEAQQHNTAVSIRGLPEDSFDKSMQTIRQTIIDNHEVGAINIDPPAFKQYGITKVPAVVLLGDDGKYDVVYGTSTIKQALKIMQDEGGDAKESAKAELAKP